MERSDAFGIMAVSSKRKNRHRHLRLIFGGRFVAMKGVMDLAPFAALHAFELTMQRHTQHLIVASRLPAALKIKG